MLDGFLSFEVVLGTTIGIAIAALLQWLLPAEQSLLLVQAGVIAGAAWTGLVVGLRDRS